MTNDLAAIKKGKKRVRLFYAAYLVSIVVFTAIELYILQLISDTYAPLLIVALVLYASLTNNICFNKYILSLIYEKLDPDAYLAAIHYGRFNGLTATLQLFGERYCGNYRNVIGISSKKLSDTKVFKKYAYSYYAYLANTYFDIGDDDSLRNACDQYEQFLASKSPRMQKKIRKRTSIMEFFGAYLAGDYDKCIQIASNPTNSNLVKHTRTYFKAKILLAQGEYDKARELFNSLATDVPQLNIGKISAQILSNMDNQKENPAKVELTTDASVEYDDAVIYPSIWRGRKVISYSLLAVAMFIALLPVFMQINAANEYNAQMAALMEDIRVMVEEDHDGVEVLDFFSLMHGEENVDEMFIYKTETHIIAGVLFTYEGQEDEIFYENQARIPLESLSSGRTTLLRFSFPTEVTDHQVYGYFYLGESDLPEEYIQMSSFEVDGKKVYFVVTEIYEK